MFSIHTQKNADSIAVRKCLDSMQLQELKQQCILVCIIFLPMRAKPSHEQQRTELQK